MSMKYPCKNCEDRYHACWATCGKYIEAVQNSKKIRDEADMYLASKKKYYKTKYGWRKRR